MLLHSGTILIKKKESEMAIKIEIEHWEYDYNTDIEECTFTNELLVSDLESNLMDCVRKIASSKWSACFDGYYPNIAPDSIYESGLGDSDVLMNKEWTNTLMDDVDAFCR